MSGTLPTARPDYPAAVMTPASTVKRAVPGPAAELLGQRRGDEALVSPGDALPHPLRRFGVELGENIVENDYRPFLLLNHGRRLGQLEDERNEAVLLPATRTGGSRRRRAKFGTSSCCGPADRVAAAPLRFAAPREGLAERRGRIAPSRAQKEQTYSHGEAAGRADDLADELPGPRGELPASRAGCGRGSAPFAARTSSHASIPAGGLRPPCAPPARGARCAA